MLLCMQELVTTKLNPVLPTHVSRTRTGAYARSRSALEARATKLKRLVAQLRRTMPWFERSDDVALKSLAEIEHVSSLCFMELLRVGVLGKDDSGRRLLSDYRLLKATELAYLNALGATPEGRLLQRSHATGAALNLAAALAQRSTTEDGIKHLTCGNATLSSSSARS